MGRNWIRVVAIRDDHKLVTTGPFRIVRHPMYASMGLLGVSVLLATGSVLAGASLVCLCVALGALRIDEEEALMRARFGAAHARYVREVPWRLIPYVW